jgi:hypothetical protein
MPRSAVVAATAAPRALPFVYPVASSDDDDDADAAAAPRFEVGAEALALLASLRVPVAPVAVVGRSRTGKSFLLNRLISGGGGGAGGGGGGGGGGDAHGAAAGFAVGSTVEACTRGINLWSEPLMRAAPDGSPYAVLWLDTEGVSSTEANAEHDARVFALAVLLSSVVIYNSVGVIDEDAISGLGFIANLTRHIQAQSGGDDAKAGSGDSDDDDGGGSSSGGASRRAAASAAAPPFPSFLWVLRDFSLELVGEGGEAMTSSEYLEGCLAPQQGFSSDSQARNRVRSVLTQSFTRRACATLVRPVDDEAALAKLDALPERALRPEFREQSAALREQLLGALALPRAAVGGRGAPAMTGRVLAGLARAYVAAINARAVPSIGDAWGSVSRAESAEACAASLRAYAGAMSQDARAALLPMDEPALTTLHERHAAESGAAFEQAAVGPAARAFRRELAEGMAAHFAELRAANARASEAACAALAVGAWHEAVESPRAGGAAYGDGGGSGGGGGGGAGAADLAADLARMRELYFADARGPAAHRALAQFLSGPVALPGVLRSALAAGGAAAEAQREQLEARLAEAAAALAGARARAEVLERQVADLRRRGESGAADGARAAHEVAAAREAAGAERARAERLSVELAAAAAALEEERLLHARARVERRAGGLGGGGGGGGGGLGGLGGGGGAGSGTGAGAVADWRSGRGGAQAAAPLALAPRGAAVPAGIGAGEAVRFPQPEQKGACCAVA